MEPEPFANRRILLIDDNESIHEDFRKILCPNAVEKVALASAAVALFGEPENNASAGQFFEVDSAFQGTEGLAKVRDAAEEGHPYALAFVDVRMPPGWDGIETVARIWEEYPDLQIVICTAYSDYSLAQIVGRLGTTDQMVILKKPFDTIEVVQLACALTEKWRLLQQSRSHVAELERRVAERTRQLEAQQEQLLEARKLELVGRLAGGIAHDFNTLLTTIIGHADLIQQTTLGAGPVAHSAEQIEKSAHRAATLVQQLLAFSRKQMLQPEVLDLNAVVEDMESVLKGILGETMAVQIVTRIRDPWVKADCGQVQQVLISLALNARDAMSDGGQFTLETSLVTLDENYAASHAEVIPGEYVMIAVKDNGTGIPDEVKSRLFEPFFTTKAPGQGTGLGLAMCYGILKQSRGHISVCSALGKGTTFHIYLPRVPAPDLVAETYTAPISAAAPNGTATILLVEENVSLREMSAAVLKKLGYTVYAVATGGEALKIAQSHAHIDLLLSDMALPQMRHLQPRMKLIFTLTHSEEEIMRQGLHDSRNEFLRRPYSPTMLVREIRSALRDS